MFSKKNKNINKTILKDKKNNVDYLKNPEILEVNLVKDEIFVIFDWNKSLFVALLVFILAGLFVFEVYLGLDYWEDRENKKAVAIAEETSKLKKEISELTDKAKDAISFKDKSSAFSDLLNNHVYWTRFFTWFEANTLNTVNYAGFSGDLSGSYSLKATAPSFAEASWQVKVFSDNENVKNVSVSSVESLSEVASLEDNFNKLEPGTVSFSLNLEVNPEIFKKK